MSSFINKLSEKPALLAGITSLLLALSLLISTKTSQAQTPYHFAEGSQISVAGTSNLHDWSMLVKGFSCDAAIVVKGDELQDVTALSLSIPVKNLKSKESLMDTRAYKTLKADEFSTITFKLTGATVNAAQQQILASGNLTIAGTTKAVKLELNYTVGGSEILFKGTATLKMSDYQIKAPSFMLGALKTGNDLKIAINLKMKK